RGADTPSGSLAFSDLHAEIGRAINITSLRPPVRLFAPLRDKTTPAASMDPGPAGQRLPRHNTAGLACVPSTRCHHGNRPVRHQRTNIVRPLGHYLRTRGQGYGSSAA